MVCALGDPASDIHVHKSITHEEVGGRRSRVGDHRMLMITALLMQGLQV